MSWFKKANEHIPLHMIKIEPASRQLESWLSGTTEEHACVGEHMGFFFSEMVHNSLFFVFFVFLSADMSTEVE